MSNRDADFYPLLARGARPCQGKHCGIGFLLGDFERSTIYNLRKPKGQKP